MFRRLLLMFFFFTFIFTPRSQLHNSSPAYFDVYKQAEKLYNSPDADETTDNLALTKYSQVIYHLAGNNTNDTILFDSYFKQGIILASQKKEKKSLQSFVQAIALNNGSSVIADSLSFLPWLFAGDNYYSVYNPDSALYCYKQAEQLFLLYPGLAESERLYNKMGVLYYEAGDYKKTIPYFTKALSLVNPAKKGSDYFIVNYKNNIASALRKLHFYEKSLDMYKSLLAFNINSNEVLHNIGVTYLDAGRYKEGLLYLKRVLYSSASLYNDRARAYLGLKQLDSAKINIEAALKIYTLPGVQRSPDYANTLKLSGDVLMANQQPQAALVQYQSAILKAYPDFKDTALSKSPVMFKGLYPFFFLFDVLAEKAKAFEKLYELHPSEKSFLTNAFSTYGSALTLSAYMERIYASDEAKLFLKKNVDVVYKAAIDVGLKLYELTADKAFMDKVFTHVEDSKSSVLQAAVHGLELNSIKGMPVQLLGKERELKSALAGLNLTISTTIDSTRLNALQQQAQELVIQLSQIQEQLNDNPAYYRLKFGLKKQSISSLRKNLLKKDEAILSFYQTSKRLVCYYITRQQYGYVSTPVDSNFKNDINKVRFLVNETDGSDNVSLKTLSISLYGRLIAPVSSHLQQIQHLIIIPHEDITYIPVELLINPSSGHLLLEDYAVSYQYSANFLTIQQSLINRYDVLAMAPFTKPSSSALPQLAASFSEIDNLPGLILTDSEATKKAFIHFCSAYPVVHLATHAIANDSLPDMSYISFYEKDKGNDSTYRLYEQEIYHLDMTRTSLAILSACETGSGQLINSEGVISLSRAFSYAGCKSVITSLWKADDVATAFIAKRLHHYLQRGFEKDIALQQSKLDYLQSDTVEARFKKPSYWANLILIGDPHPVKPSEKHWFAIIGVLSVLIVLVLYVKKNVFKKRTP